MAFFDDLSSKATKLGKSVSQKAKSMTDSVQLSSQLNDQKKNLGKLFEELGKMAYQNEEVCSRAEFANVVEMIKNSEKTIKDLEQQISIAKGQVQCKNCGTFVPNGNAFCQNCGAKIEVPVAPQPQQQYQQPAQPQQPMQSQQSAQPQGGFDWKPVENDSDGGEKASAVCSGCGKPLSPDSAFCTNCGQPVNK